MVRQGNIETSPVNSVGGFRKGAPSPNLLDSVSDAGQPSQFPITAAVFLAMIIPTPPTSMGSHAMELSRDIFYSWI